MNNATLEHFRDMAAALGCGLYHDYCIAIDRTIGEKTITFCQAFGLTKEQAENAARYYKGGRAALTSEILKQTR